MNPLDFTAGPFLAFYTGVAILAWLIAGNICRRIGKSERAHPALTPPELAYLAGGEQRVVDAFLAGLLASKAASLSTNGAIVDIDRDRVEKLPDMAAFARLGLSGETRRYEFPMRLRPAVESIRTKLRQLGLIPHPSQLPAYRLKIIAVFAVPILLGLAKVNVGLERHKPVGFLIALLVLTALIALRNLGAPRLTHAGRKALAASKKQNARAARAPLEHELMLAVALTGLIVLSGTPYHALHATAQTGEGGSGSDGGGGGDGGGDGGGGCGGGGCGGCGGS